MPNQIDQPHKAALGELGQSLLTNFDRIDKNRDGQLSVSELKDASNGAQLSLADRAMAGFAANNIKQIAAIYQGLNRPGAEAKLPGLEITSKDNPITKDDIGVMLHAAGKNLGPDPFRRDRANLANASAIVEAGYGAYAGAAGGPLVALGGAAVGGGLGWGISRGVQRATFGSADGYYEIKGARLQNIDLTGFPHRSKH